MAQAWLNRVTPILNTIRDEIIRLRAFQIVRLGEGPYQYTGATPACFIAGVSTQSASGSGGAHRWQLRVKVSVVTQTGAESDYEFVNPLLAQCQAVMADNPSLRELRTVIVFDWDVDWQTLAPGDAGTLIVGTVSVSYSIQDALDAVPD